MAISEADKAKLLTDLKAGAVNVIALHPMKKGEKEGFDEVMDEVKAGISWLGLATGKGRVVIYKWPLAQVKPPAGYDELAVMLRDDQGYGLLHIEELGIMAQVLETAEALLQEGKILLLFDYQEAPGGNQIVTFFIVPMEGFEEIDPSFREVLGKVRGSAC